MHQLLGFVFVVYLIYISSTCCRSESCLTVRDCTVTSCTKGGTLMCTHEGQCTCGILCKDGTNYQHRCGINPNVPDSAECQIWYEYEAEHPCECEDGHLHCIDGYCHCGYPPN